MALKPEHIQNFQKPEEPPKQSETFKTPPPSVDISAPVPEKSLFVIHETRPHQIHHFDEVHDGFIPGPSLAIAHKDRGVLDSFGAIKLLAHPSLVDPKKPDVHVFNMDASTPTGMGYRWFDGDGNKLMEAFGWKNKPLSHIESSFDPQFLNGWNEEDGYYSEPLKAFRKEFGDHLAHDKNKELHHYTKWVNNKFKESGYRKLTAAEDVAKQKLKPIIGGEIEDIERPDVHYAIRKLASLDEIKKHTENLSGKIGPLPTTVTPGLHRLPIGVTNRVKLKIIGEYNHGKYKSIEDAIDANVYMPDKKEKTRFADGIRDMVENHIKKQPTRYLEAKILRPVHLSEFHTALVPHDTDAETIKTLQKYGLKTIGYHGTSDVDNKLREELERNNLLLSEKTVLIWPTQLKKHDFHNWIAGSPNFHNTEAHSPEVFAKDATPLTPEHAKLKEKFDSNHGDLKTVQAYDPLLSIGVNTKVIHKIGKDKYMVKPYASGEGMSQRVFHAAGLGHLHQKSFATNYSEDGSPAPATVIKINPGYKTLQAHEDAMYLRNKPIPGDQNTRRDFLKTALLDQVLGAKDRHTDNVMLHKETGVPLVIDNDGVGREYTGNNTFTGPDVKNRLRRLSRIPYLGTGIDSGDDIKHVTQEWWPTVRDSVLAASQGHPLSHTIAGNIQKIDNDIDLEKNLDENKMPHVIFPPGEEKIAKALPYKANLIPERGTQDTYNYTHLLPKEATQNGYSLKVVNKSPNQWHSIVYHNGNNVGSVEGYRAGKGKVEPHSHINREHQGKGLGQKAYEALFTHVREHAGLSTVSGGVHSEKAERVHRALAKKHGFEIQGSGFVDPDDPHGPYPYNSYSYELGPAPERYKPPESQQKLQLYTPHPKDVRHVDETGSPHSTSGPSEITHHGNGRVSRILYHKHGKLHRKDGPAFASFFDNGKIEALEHAKNGKITNRAVYYPNGVLRSKWTPTEETLYDSTTGNKIKHNVYTPGRVPISATHYHPTTGVVTTKHTYHPNGQRKTSEHYYNNGTFGEILHYDEAGLPHHDTEPARKVFGDDREPIEEYWKHGVRQYDPINKHEGHEYIRGKENIHSDSTDSNQLKQDALAPLPTPEHHALKDEFDRWHHEKKTIKTNKLNEDKFAVLDGINPKVIHKFPSGNKFMVKPYTAGESLSQRVFHAAGIGHLHQKSFTTNYAGDTNPLENYATVIHIQPDYQDLVQARRKNSKSLKSTDLLDLGKIGIMDYLLGQHDRHLSNIMIHKKTGKPLAIDNDGIGSEHYGSADSRDVSFSMHSPYNSQLYKDKNLKANIINHLMRNWWPTVKDSVYQTFQNHPSRENIEKNFNKLNNFKESQTQQQKEEFLGSKSKSGSSGMEKFGKHEGHDAFRGAKNAHFEEDSTDDGALEQGYPLPTQKHHELKNEFDANHHDRKTLKTFKQNEDEEFSRFHPYPDSVNKKVIHKIGSNKYMVKPFTQNEGLSQRAFHAAGLGHLHQKSFTSEYSPSEFATVVHMNKGHKTLKEISPETEKKLKKDDFAKIAVMDMALGQMDRHGNNIMVHTKTGRPLAIDNEGIRTWTRGYQPQHVVGEIYNNQVPYQLKVPNELLSRDDIKKALREWWPTVSENVANSIGDHPFKKQIANNIRTLNEGAKHTGEYVDEDFAKHEGHDYIKNNKNFHASKYEPSDLEADLITQTPEHEKFKKEFEEHHKNEDTIKHKIWQGDRMSAFGGINPKIIHRINGNIYMVKPYTNKEALSQRVFHAAGVPHLHQKSFTSHYSEDGHTDPATVIKLDGDYTTLHDANGFAKNHDDWVKLHILDFALGQGDRHGNNVMVHRKTGMPMAIDNEGLRKNSIERDEFDGTPLTPYNIPSYIKNSKSFRSSYFDEAGGDGYPKRKLSESVNNHLKNWWPTVRDSVVGALGNHPLKDTIKQNVAKLDATSEAIKQKTPPPPRPSNPHNIPGESTGSAEPVQKSEVDVMLSNPNHVERLLAVKLDSFKRKHVPTALFDDSPSVWQEILHHDAFKKYATKILVACPVDDQNHDLWPKQEYALKNNLLDSKELDTLYSTILHTNMDEQPQKARLQAVSEAKAKLNAA